MHRFYQTPAVASVWIDALAHERGRFVHALVHTALLAHRLAKPRLIAQFGSMHFAGASILPSPGGTPALGTDAFCFAARPSGTPIFECLDQRIFARAWV
jgi:hypothetical protein